MGRTAEFLHTLRSSHYYKQKLSTCKLSIQIFADVI